MLRTFRLDFVTKQPVEPMLIWLPAAPAFERAGKWLTDRIKEDWVKEGRPLATAEEAEIYKTSGVTDWHSKPWLLEWCESISETVAEYMKSVPDEMRLPKYPPLEVVITGGSSGVEPIKPILMKRIARALVERGISEGLSNQTTAITVGPSNRQMRGYSDIEIAQLAVCLGASHPRMAQLKHYPEGL